MKAAFVRPPPRDLGVRGASIVRCWLSCLVDLNSDLYRLYGSFHGLDTFWAQGLSWINKETTTTTTTTHRKKRFWDSSGVEPIHGVDILWFRYRPRIIHSWYKSKRTAYLFWSHVDMLESSFKAQSSRLKAQSSNVAFATFSWTETYELWALSFELWKIINVTPKWGRLYLRSELRMDLNILKKNQRDLRYETWGCDRRLGTIHGALTTPGYLRLLALLHGHLHLLRVLTGIAETKQNWQFAPDQQKGSENRSWRFEPKMSLISFLLGSGPPFRLHVGLDFV